MQAMADLEFVFEEGSHSKKLTEIALIFHQGQVVLDVVKNIGDAGSVQGTEIQVEWKFPCLDVLSHGFLLLPAAFQSLNPGVNVRTKVVSTDIKKSS